MISMPLRKYTLRINSIYRFVVVLQCASVCCILNYLKKKNVASILKYCAHFHTFIQLTNKLFCSPENNILCTFFAVFTKIPGYGALLKLVLTVPLIYLEREHKKPQRREHLTGSLQTTRCMSTLFLLFFKGGLARYPNAVDERCRRSLGKC